MFENSVIFAKLHYIKVPENSPHQNLWVFNSRNLKRMITKDYQGTLELIRHEIQTARFQVVKAITKEHIDLYWKIGKIIVEKQEEEGWGKSVVEKISNDLQKDFPGSNGYSARNLWDMRRFYSRYSTNKKLRQLVAEIPWGQNLLILTKIKNDNEAEFYLNATKEYGWSRNVLLNQIKAQAYKKALSENKTHNFQTALPEYLSEQADEALKSEYNLEFLGLKEGVKERELEMKTGLVIIWTIYAEYPYPNRDQEIAGITRDKKKQIKERKILFNKLKAHNFGGVFKKINTCADP